MRSSFTDSKAKTATAGADNASGTHRPGPAYSISSPGTRLAANWKAMSQWLDEDRELIGPVAEDLRRHGGVKETGRQGLSGRVGLALWASQATSPARATRSWRFIWKTSASFRAFARAAAGRGPREEVGAAHDNQRHPGRNMGRRSIASCLPARVRRKSPDPARSCGSTARSPPRCCMSRATSSLLGCGSRLMVRLVKAADALIGGRLVWRNHRRAAKKRARARDRVCSRSSTRPGSSIIVS